MAVDGSSSRPGIPSPLALAAASSAAFRTESRSKEVTVAYPQRPPDHALRQMPPVLFWTSCFRFPLIVLAPMTLVVWERASANSAPRSVILDTA